MCEITIKEAGVNVLSNGSNTMLLPASKDEASADRYMEDMRRAFDAGKFTDATILCDDEEFHCHKVRSFWQVAHQSLRPCFQLK